MSCELSHETIASEAEAFAAYQEIVGITSQWAASNAMGDHSRAADFVTWKAKLKQDLANARNDWK